MRKHKTREVLRAAALISCACAGALTLINPSAANTTATWLAPVSGNWTDATKWSTNPNYPNNGTPAGTAYDAVIDATGASYTVTQGSNIALGSLTIDSAEATVTNSAYSSLTINGPLDLRDGTFRGVQGSLINATITGTGGNFVVAGSNTYSLNGVTIDRTVEADGGLLVQDGLTLTDNGMLTVRGTRSAPGASFYGTQTIGGTGTIVVDGGMQIGYGQVHDVLGPGVTLTTNPTGGYGYIEPFQYLADANLTNRGTIWARTPGKMLDLDATWTNQGILKVSDGAVLGLGGQFHVSDIGTVQNLGGTVRITGILNNAGTTFALNSSTGSWEMGEQGVISGGTLTTQDGAVLRAGYFANAPPVLDHVNVQGDLDFARNVFVLRDGTTLPSDRTININGQLDVDQPTLDGTMNLNLVNGFITTGHQNTMTIGPNVTIRGSGQLDPGRSGSPATAVNQGTITTVNGGSLMIGPDGSFNNLATIEAVENGSISINAQSWTNSGVIRIGSGGQVSLGGNFTVAQMGAIQSLTGAMPTAITGSLDNSNTTLAITDTTGSFALTGGSATLTGGTVTTSGSAKFFLGGYLRGGVTLAGDGVVIGGLIHAEEGLHLDNATISFQPTTAGTGTLFGNNATFLDGAGAIRFDGAGGTIATIGEDYVLPTTITVRTGSGSGSLGANGTLDGLNEFRGIVNQSLISAETPGNSITLYKLTNQGTVRAINGGTIATVGTWSNSGSLVLDHGTFNLGGSFTTADIASMNRTGGSVVISGSLNNANTTLTLGHALGSFELDGGTISGGVIETTDGQTLTAVSGSSALLASTFIGQLDVTGGTMTFASVNHGVMDVSGSAALSLETGWENFEGTINFSSSGILQLGGTYTFPDAFANIHRTSGSVYLAGTATNAGNTLSLDASTGSWRLLGTIVGGDIRTREGTTLYLSSGATLSGVNTLDGELSVLPGAKANINGGMTLVNGRIVLPHTHGETPAMLIVGGAAATLGGTGEIVFDNPIATDTSMSPALWPAARQTLTIGPNVTVRTGTGSGTVGAWANGFVINQGLILAQTPGQSITLAGNFTNRGIIEADRGASIVIGTFYSANGFVNDGGDIRIAAGATLSSHYPLTFNGGAVGGDGTIIAAGGASVTGTVMKFGTGIFDVGGSGLAVASGAQLDLTVGKLIARAPSAQLGTWNGATYTDLTGLIQSGRNGGTWDGPGVMTSYSNGGDHNEIGIASAAQALGISATQTGTWMGQFVNGSDVLVMYTYGGDANLDGKLNIDDYGRIDASVGQSGSVFGWYNGDFNYDGKINIDDYGIIDSNIGSQGPPLGIAPASLAGIAQADGITAVPEPASILLLLLPLLAQPARRRRCKI